jgi:hypothetical protein
MSKLIAFAEAKDALGFQTELHEAISEKVSLVLENLREQVAADLFNSEETNDKGSFHRWLKPQVK